MAKKRITIFDGNNYLRRKYEETRGTSALRDVVMDIRTELASPGNMCMFVFDGVHCNRYRREFFPGYKVGRPPTPDGFNEQKKILKEILSHMPIMVLEVEGYEADDLIAAAVKNFQASPLFKDVSIHIKSTDKDFHQLGVSYEGKELPFPAEETVLYKTLVGDQSDKIPGIPGFGQKKFEALDKEAALQWLADDFPLDRIPVQIPESLCVWIRNNQETLRAYKKTCEFRPVPEKVLTDGIPPIKNEPHEVERLLQENLA
jgi:5'-3' exonuclease